MDFLNPPIAHVPIEVVGMMENCDIMSVRQRESKVKGKESQERECRRLTSIDVSHLRDVPPANVTVKLVTVVEHCNERHIRRTTWCKARAS